MKKYSIAIAFTVFVMMSFNSFAENLTITIDGMVCAFCAQGIEKKFSKDAAVESVKVDLDEKKVELHLKKDGKLDDTKIQEIIESSGFRVNGKIQRSI